MNEKKFMKLPLSERLERSLQDLEECEKDFRYSINMKAWHTPVADKCLVCHAGAVIAKSFNSPMHRCSPNFYEDDVRDFLVGIDSLRNGDFFRALGFFNVPLLKRIRFFCNLSPWSLSIKTAPYKGMPAYHTFPNQYKETFKLIIQRFRDIGL